MKKRLLLVDDECDFVEMLQFLMPQYEFRVARNPEEALETMEEFQPDLLLVDLVLPGMRGGELARIIHEEPEFADIPVFLLSGLIQSRADNGEPVLVDGCVGFGKPFDLAELQKQIAIHLAGGKPAQAALHKLRRGSIAGE